MRYTKQQIIVFWFFFFLAFSLSFPLQLLSQKSIDIYVATSPTTPAKTSQSSEKIKVVNRIVVSTVTAYSSVDSCHHPHCVMANGRPASLGYVACPRKLKLGSQVLINEKKYTCGDRTAERFDGRFDIFLGYGIDAHKKALAWGKQKLVVTIIK